MAKKANGETPGAVAAAHDTIEDFIGKVGKAHDTLKAHCEQLQDENAEVKQRMSAAEAAHTAELAREKASREREVTDLRQRLSNAEDKLRKTVAIIGG